MHVSRYLFFVVLKMHVYIQILLLYFIIWYCSVNRDVFIFFTRKNKINNSSYRNTMFTEMILRNRFYFRQKKTFNAARCWQEGERNHPPTYDPWHKSGSLWRQLLKAPSFSFSFPPSTSWRENNCPMIPTSLSENVNWPVEERNDREEILYLKPQARGDEMDLPAFERVEYETSWDSIPATTSIGCVPRS